ncbi:hypothetical protein [Pajaroellobacter abortibovis]|uniref:Uncharacterized protein n=1 Tax=Pajaroellobacter abortibovis TaxID=1882918 RepID=A0A1L6MV92_9BACT|nr:hypothetical protein [Pajaroellobacter abortibovis]APR99433.1 hypothetical protein BCY86_01095 [Pajaroellobacter abortibovis]
MDGKRCKWQLGIAILIRVGMLLGAGSCSTMQSSASKDPLRCERDLACRKDKAAAEDCATQCAYGPECMERCREMTKGLPLHEI